ncbi:NAD-dependent epimerase/dehydratase family protein [Amylibacter sp.]|nr:NAD-dependent epimerase/dehydratase family protein [Amylibacter sp.]
MKSKRSIKKRQEIVLLGGSGFVGTHLIQELLSYGNYSLSLLIHKSPPVVPELAGRVRLVNGDFFDERSLDAVILPDSIVINLVYLSNETRASNTVGLQNVLTVCKRKNIKRFIHISTAVVSGRASVLTIDEEVVDVPFSDYEKTKLGLENLVVSAFKYSSTDLVILRPTAVFGSSGKNALKLIDGLKEDSLVKNYLKACLFNTRRFNLVPVSYLVSAITFFVAKQSVGKKDIFIVSADDEIDNNYQFVEESFRISLGLKKYPIPIVPVPKIILSIFLIIAGRSSIYPLRVYSPKKLKQIGWQAPEQFHDAILAFSQSKNKI